MLQKCIVQQNGGLDGDGVIKDESNKWSDSGKNQSKRYKSMPKAGNIPRDD